MDKKKKLITRTGASLSWQEREAMIVEYLRGSSTKAELWYKYTGQREEHGQLLNWMRKLGYISRPVVGKRAERFVTLRQQAPLALDTEQRLDQQALERRIQELEKQLETARLKAEGYELMIQIAEEELYIPIRKKSAAR
jgi:transposase